MDSLGVPAVLNRHMGADPEQIFSTGELEAAQAALQILHELHGTQILNFLRHFNKDQSEDLYQDAWAQAWAVRASFSKAGIPFGAWLHRLTKNLCVDWLRGKHGRVRRKVAGHEQERECQPARRMRASFIQMSPEFDPKDLSSISADEELLKRERDKLMIRWKASLSKENKFVVWHLSEGRTLPQIAALMPLTVHQLRERRKLFKIRLRSYLERHGY